MKDLFNQTYLKKIPLEREWNIRNWFILKMKSALKNIKTKNFYCAKLDIETFRGMLQYAYSAHDIDMEIYQKMYNITKILVNKYLLYLI